MWLYNYDKQERFCSLLEVYSVTFSLHQDFPDTPGDQTVLCWMWSVQQKCNRLDHNRRDFSEVDTLLDRFNACPSACAILKCTPLERD